MEIVFCMPSPDLPLADRDHVNTVAWGATSQVSIFLILRLFEQGIMLAASSAVRSRRAVPARRTHARSANLLMNEIQTNGRRPHSSSSSGFFSFSLGNSGGTSLTGAI